MPETLEQRQATMCRMIQHILDKKPFTDLTLEEQRIAKECVDNKYIEGVVLLEMISGRVVMECQFDPRLTEAGVAFLAMCNSPPKSELTEAQEKIANQERIIEPHIWISIGVGIVAVIVAVLSWLVPREVVFGIFQNLNNCLGNFLNSLRR